MALAMELTLSLPPALQPGPRKKEAWENVYVYGMLIAGLMVVAGLRFKPDTSYVGPVRLTGSPRAGPASRYALPGSKLPPQQLPRHGSNSSSRGRALI